VSFSDTANTAQWRKTFIPETGFRRGRRARRGYRFTTSAGKIMDFTASFPGSLRACADDFSRRLMRESVLTP
jgi:hypothetical protein